MEEFMRVSLWMIRSKVLDALLGLMEENIKAIGRLESSMEEVSTICLMDNQRLVNGIKVKRFVGLKKNRMLLQFIDI
jgi:hypothetical protein